MMENPNSSMVSNQLCNRRIFAQSIIKAFSVVDRGDFVPLTYSRSAYIDQEIPVRDSYVMLRGFVLASVMQEIIDRNLRDSKILIIGDASGYTGSLFSEIFSKCTIGTVDNSLTEYLRSKVDIPAINLFDIKGKFDVIFFDSGVYKTETTEKIKSNFLDKSGILINLSRMLPPNLSKTTFEFSLVSLNVSSFEKVSPILESNLLLGNSFIA